MHGGALYIVATPIGNLQDASPRSLATLQAVDLIACEDTRRTLKLLSHFGIQKPLTSYHEFNEEAKAAELSARIESGATVALVSDAGTPAISDPGFRLVRRCRERGLPVIAVPGPNAAVTALSVSGLPSNEFFFAGFLPSKAAARRAKLEALGAIGCTLIFYEAPHRILATLADIQETLGDRQACICRELTKLHEEYLFGKLSEIRSRVRELGEFVVVVEGGAIEGGAAGAAPRELTREDVLRILGISRNQLYDLFFRKK